MILVNLIAQRRVENPAFRTYPTRMKSEAIFVDGFVLRQLDPSDNLNAYLSWMRNPQGFPFIQSARENYSIDEIIAYINEINLSTEAIQYGIFAGKSMIHIGNIKFHDIDLQKKSCFVGFLIGDPAYQNRGLAQLFFLRCANQLKNQMQIEEFRLSVNKMHVQAIRAYQKIGFTINHSSQDSKSKSEFIMTFDL